MYEQHESCTFTDTLLGFPEYICTRSKIMDQELRLDWSQFTRKLTLLQDYTKKSLWACSSFEKMWVVNHKQNKVQWQYLRDGEKACLQDWRMDSSFLLFWKFLLFLVRSRLKPTFNIQIYLTKTINDLPSTIVFYFFPPVIWYKAGKM